MSDTKHLSAETANMLDRPVAEKMAFLRSDHWFGYPAANALLGRLERRIAIPPSGRMSGLLIVGESNNGKSHVARQLKKKYPVEEDKTTGKMRVPVLHIDMPASPDESRFYDEILTDLWQPFRAKEPVSQKSSQIRSLLSSLGTKLLFVDEIQNVLGARDDKRRALLDALRFMSNRLGITIVAIGTPDALAAFAASDSIINRLTPVVLPAWPLDQDFQRLLASFELVLPFPEPSRLSSKKTAALLHTLSEGRIGEVRDFIVEAAEDAMDAGEALISIERINATQWVPPSERKRQADVQKLRTRRA